MQVRKCWFRLLKQNLYKQAEIHTYTWILE